MAHKSAPLLLTLLLAVAAVVECDPIFFSRKNSRESDRSRERSSFSSFRTSSDDSQETVAGKTTAHAFHAFHESPLSRINFERVVNIGEPAVPIQPSDDKMKVAMTMTWTDSENNFDNDDDFDKSDEISLDDKRLTTQKRTKELRRFEDLADAQAKERRKPNDEDLLEDQNGRRQNNDLSDEIVQRNKDKPKISNEKDRDSLEERNDHSRDSDLSDEIEENDKDEALDTSNERDSDRHPVEILSSVGRPLNFPTTFSSGQPFKISVSRKSSVSSVVGRISPPSNHSGSKDKKKGKSNDSDFTKTITLNDGSETGRSDEIITPSSNAELSKKTASKSREVRPADFSIKNVLLDATNHNQKVKEEPLDVLAGTSVRNAAGLKSGSLIEEKAPTEMLQETSIRGKSIELADIINFKDIDSDDSYEEYWDINIAEIDAKQSDESDATFREKSKKDGPTTYDTPDLAIPDERSTKPIVHVLPEVAIPLPTLQIKEIEDFSLESYEKHIELLRTDSAREPEPAYVPPVYIPKAPKKLHPSIQYRPSSLLHSARLPSQSPTELKLQESDESDIESWKPFKPFSNAHFPSKSKQGQISEISENDSDETSDNFPPYRPHKTEWPLTSKQRKPESKEFATNSYATSQEPWKPLKQFYSDEIEKDSEEFIISKHTSHGITTSSYSSPLPKTHGLWTKTKSRPSTTRVRPSKHNSPRPFFPAFNDKFESDEISIESLPNTSQFRKIPQSIPSQLPETSIKQTRISQNQKYLPPASTKISSSSRELNSDENNADNSNGAALTIIPAVRLSAAYSPPSAKYTKPSRIKVNSQLKSPSPLPNDPPTIQNLPPVIQKISLRTNTYKPPKQKAVQSVKSNYPPPKSYSAPPVTKQRLVSRPKVNIPYRQNPKLTKPKAHPLKTVQNQRLTHNNVALAPHFVTQQKFISAIQPKPIQGLLLQPQQPMRYGGQFTHYVPKKGRTFNALLLTPLNNGIALHPWGQNNYFRGTYGLQQTNVPLQTVRQPIRTHQVNRRPNLNVAHLKNKQNPYSTSSSPPIPPGFVNVGSVGVPLPNQQPAQTFGSFSTDSDETIVQKSASLSPVISPNYGAPLEASYQAPQQSYEAPAACEPVVQYSVVTHDVLVPTTVEVYRTKYLPTTQYNQVIETKYYPQPQVNVVTVTSVAEPQIVTQTEVATNPVYVAQTNYETVTKYLTATQANIVTDTRVLYKTRYNTVTDVQYRTQTQTLYQTKTKYRTQYQTQTEINYQTKIEYQTQYLTSTAISKVPVYNTVTETKVKKQYVTETVPSYRTKTATQEKIVTETVTSQYPFYTTVVSTQFHPQYVTVTVTQPCNQGYGFY